MTETIRLDRLPAVLEQRGDGRSSLYLDIQRGTWTPPVRLGRSSSWPHHEVQALVRARIAGASTEQLQTIVRDLVNRRSQMMPTITGAGAVTKS